MTYLKKHARHAAKWIRAALSPKHPLHFFHHIPKCAGTSIRDWLSQRMMVLPDCRVGWSNDFPTPYDENILRSIHCVCGHFETDHNRLWERYPVALDPHRARAFTFLRDPLSMRISLWKYERAMGLHEDQSIEDSLTKRPNYIANILQADEDNWRSILARYQFVGIVEDLELSLSGLASFLNKKDGRSARLNATEPNSKYTEMLHRENLRLFEELNALDYKIYRAARQNLQRAPLE
jgi:hypothetical protein